MRAVGKLPPRSDHYAASGIAETDVEILVLPPTLFQALIAGDDSFRRHVFEVFGERLSALMQVVEAIAYQKLDHVENDQNAHVTVSSWRRVDDNMIPARGKIAGAYVNSAFAKTDAQLAGFDEALVLNQDGHLSEGSAENVFIVRNGVVCTPPVTDNMLEGITRRTVIMLLRDDLGIEVVERPIDRTELFLADEIFMTGTGVQITVVTRVDPRPVGTGKMGDIARTLRELYSNVVRGRVARYRSLLIPVYTGKEEHKPVPAPQK